jgi:hypothetical protein
MVGENALSAEGARVPPDASLWRATDPDAEQVWRHVRSGNLYRIVRRAWEEATLDPQVVYEALEGGGFVWVRPLDAFNERFERVA